MYTTGFMQLAFKYDVNMISVVILAAGCSSRMGRPKQNLQFDKVTLLQHAVRNAAAVSDDIAVVLGANYDIVVPTIQHSPVQIIFNPDWDKGMATSIQSAAEVFREKSITAVLFLVCDQPFLTGDHLKQLSLAAGTSGKGIIASGYNGTFGVPVIFKRKYFGEFSLLRNDDGAKKIAFAHQDDLLVVPFARGSIDIDTEQDYSFLNDR